MPGHGAAAAAGSVPERKAGSVPERKAGSVREVLAPGHPTHLFRGRPSPDRDRGDHRLGPEHPLHPCERTRGVVGGSGIAAPEPELATGRGHDLVGHERNSGDAPGRGEPALELPPHPRDEGRGGERAVVTPAAREPFAVLGLRFHDDTGARQPELVEPAEQLVGQALRRERGFVDTFRGRIELDRLDQLGWKRGGNRLVRGLAAREPVRVHTRKPEPAEH